MKLNFGCGQRYAKGWINIDFHSDSPDVQRVNLLQPLPFPAGYFDVVYSSHTLEHFSLNTTERILKECFRIMKPGAIIRTVLPDLESTCREYLRVLDQTDSSDLARRQYEWVILELLDQLTRTTPSGRMPGFWAELQRKGDREMVDYVRSRTEANLYGAPVATAKAPKITLPRIRNKLIYVYIQALKKLIPPSLRDAVVDDTRIGEKHRWMYDRYSLKQLLERVGLVQVTNQNASTSQIEGFNDDFLDIERDGRDYKRCSLYCEARKPGRD